MLGHNLESCLLVLHPLAKTNRPHHTYKAIFKGHKYFSARLLPLSLSLSLSDDKNVKIACKRDSSVDFVVTFRFKNCVFPGKITESLA